ncbi:MULTISPECIES: sensor histidine kinase [Halorubrum]|uniref:histidine kinase n=1 Tax=Halorubrum hochstenium ATCC 700873 TaxID=1227481 RepID=M0F736_9EURY|nr:MULTISPECIES: HAMP domain-containing sensor histidine kinase [Halorubrum]ELZ55017.1 membrane associated histidine kinase [Halorubrum hochstenium ATCC 700873]
MGTVGFLLINLGFMAAIPTTTTFQVVGWARWAIGFGGGIGLAVGVFEARAIDREVAAERARVRREKAERERDRLDEFASVVSHDLRNPLSVATGRLDLARREHPDDEHLRAVENALERTSAIVDETLALAREGKTVDEAADVDLATCAADCWARVDTGEATLETAETATIRADPDRLSHVFENLFRNSVEHGSTSSRTESGDSVEHGPTSSRTESGDSVEHGPTSSRAEPDDSVEHGSTGSRTESGDAVGDGGDVTVRVGTLADESGFYVEDDGPGIPADERDRVLDPGYTSADDGTGFGLSIVDRIAAAHGWTVRVAESADGGARFEFAGVERPESE